MRKEKFLMGNLREKKRISQLLDSSPILIHYDYMYLCITMLEYLEDQHAENAKDYDSTLVEFLSSMEVDIQEQTQATHSEITRYLSRVEDAMQYFKYYLLQLRWLPLPHNVHVGKGTPSSVLTLYIL